ncbi:hypothetical protein [Chromobacterium haemolyticum]|uniref:hypothetical protein n=1 Tax=Chromobacterium haemolyticum TaxID=394935 RepID=UPI0013B3CDB5|nr:hypothetical protein [Chromobacterium haemolyticum]
MNQLENNLAQLVDATNEFLMQFSGKKIHKDTNIHLQNLHILSDKSRKALESHSSEKIIESANNFIPQIQFSTLHFKNISLSEEQKNALEKILEKKNALAAIFDDESYKPTFQINGNLEPLSQNDENSDIDNTLENTQKKISSLETIVESIKNESDSAIQKAQDLYKQAKKDVYEYHKEINELRQLNATSTLSGGFEGSANSERKAANTLRILSVITMSFAVFILAYSIWESTNTAISLPVLAYRATVAILITAPAAYLARESAKHRNKQYHYQQISLELATITPYLASLPIELQNEIKGAAARTIFTKEKVIEKLDETFPINAQELILETIKSLKQVSSQAINKSSK